ncbi:hypothetical protein X884_5654 [Burkholderia pseudomallei MSHR4308]|nr:hypothetical protein [Burkholderia pseudomallei]KGV34748.1 hypothetical protein X884_5654 [Burkholderia pseudomallei MSHR4308]
MPRNLPSRGRRAWRAYFDGRRPARPDIEVDLIHRARTRVLVAGGASVPAAVAAALCAARGRGVDVRVVCSIGRGARPRYSGAAFLANAGIDVVLSDRVSMPNAHGPFPSSSTMPVVLRPRASFAQNARRARGRATFERVLYRAPQLAQSYATAFWRLYGLARR